MASEWEKMLAGQLYDALDPELVRARARARDLCQDLNATREADQEVRRRILKEPFGKGGDSVWMQPPFFCDYGSNILLGARSCATCCSGPRRPMLRRAEGKAPARHAAGP